MGRTREFDERAVLDGAMHAFRRAGFGALSIRDLEQATGLSSGSLYNAYGSKEALFRVAFDHYVETIIRVRLDAYAGPDAGLDQLEHLLLSLWEFPQTDGHGCLMTNTLVESDTARSIAAEGIKRGSSLLASRIMSVLEREIGRECSVLETDHLILLYHGTLVMSRGGRLSHAYADVVRSEFERLRVLRGKAPT